MSQLEIHYILHLVPSWWLLSAGCLKDESNFFFWNLITEPRFYSDFSKTGTLKQTEDCSAISISMRLPVHLSEAVTDINPLVASRPFHSQLHVQESRLLWGLLLFFFSLLLLLKLSMFLFWVQKSLDRLTMCPLWQGAPYASKRWLTSWQGCGDNTALYRENSAATQSAGCRLGERSPASAAAADSKEPK